MLLASVPNKFPIPFGNSAAGAFIRNVPTASQIGIVDGAASLTDGFPPLNFDPISAGGVPPFGQDFNGLLKQITLWCQWQGAGAPVQFDVGFAASIGGYPKGATVLSTNGVTLWKSAVDSNSVNPDAGISPNWTTTAEGAQIAGAPVNLSIAIASNQVHYVALNAITMSLPQTSTTWNGFGFYVNARDGDVLLSVFAGDNISGTASVGQNMTIPAGAQVYVLTNGAGTWFVEGMPWMVQKPRVVTGTYNITSSDNAKILKHFSGAFGTFIFPAASSLPADFRVMIINGETTAIGKGVGGTNLGSFTQYPQQTYTVINDNGTIRVLGNRQLYLVDTVEQFSVKSTGLADDPLLGDGLASGTRSFGTLNAMARALYSNFNHDGSQPICWCTGTFGESVTFGGQPINTGVFYWNGTSSGAFIWKPSSNFCAIFGDGAIITFTNCYFDSAVVAFAIQQHQSSICDIHAGCAFGSFGNPGGTHFGSDGAGWTLNIHDTILLNGVGGAAVHCNALGAGVVNITGGIHITNTVANNNIGVFYAGIGATLINMGLGIVFDGGGTYLGGLVQWQIGPGCVFSTAGNSSSIPGTAGNPALNSGPGAHQGWVI